MSLLWSFVVLTWTQDDEANYYRDSLTYDMLFCRTLDFGK
jgi:hypothetical protein